MRSNDNEKISYALILTLISSSTILGPQSSPDSSAQKAGNKDNNDSIISPVNKNVIQGKWEELKGKIKKQWEKLTKDDLLQVEGRLQDLAGIVQAKYGYEKIRAEEDVKEFLKLNNIDINEYNDATISPCLNSFTHFQDNITELYGFKNEKSEIIIPPQFENVSNIGEEDLIGVIKKGTFYRMDRKGNLKFESVFFDNGWDYYEQGLARFLKNGKVGFHDKKGNIIIKPEYDFAKPFGSSGFLGKFH